MSDNESSLFGSWREQPRRRMAVLIRTLLAFFGTVALLMAMWAGLVRGGWDFPPLRAGLPGVHGPLAVCGFLGTLFSLERAFAAKSISGYLAPLLISAGSFVLLLFPVSSLGPLVIAAGSAAFLVLCFLNLRFKWNLFTSMIAVGSVIWFVGIWIWVARWPVFNVYLWWMSFVLFGLIGQRLELAQRIRLNTPPFKVLGAFMLVVLLGQVLMATGHLLIPENMDIYIDAIVDPRLKWGMRIAGVGMVLTAAWLLRYDAAWATMKQGGVAGYMSFCLISGYVWLGISGIFSLVFGGLVSGVRYDALLHSFFVGFVFFVLFAHGPAIFSSSFGLRFPNTKWLMGVAVFLHLGLAARMAGDLLRQLELKNIGGLMNSLATLFFLGIVFSVVREPVSRYFGRVRASENSRSDEIRDEAS